MLDEVDPLTSADNWGYDAAGRQTRDDGAGFSSASFHFPGAAFHDITLTAGTVQMRYNGANRRLQKNVVNGLKTDYIRDKDGRVLAVYENNTLKERYVWGPLGLVKIVKGLNGSETDYYVLNDHLGYVRVVVDDSGDAVAGYDYFPYGKEMAGRWSENAGAGSRFKFGAKEFDTDLGLELYYFEARFYNPEIERFVSPDPLRVGWSHYAFANNNPLRFIDPTGLDPEESQDPGKAPSPGTAVVEGTFFDGEYHSATYHYENGKLIKVVLEDGTVIVPSEATGWGSEFWHGEGSIEDSCEAAITGGIAGFGSMNPLFGMAVSGVWYLWKRIKRQVF